jgi:hypothetical protein
MDHGDRYTVLFLFDRPDILQLNCTQNGVNYKRVWKEDKHCNRFKLIN